MLRRTRAALAVAATFAFACCLAGGAAAAPSGAERANAVPSFLGGSSSASAPAARGSRAPRRGGAKVDAAAPFDPATLSPEQRRARERTTVWVPGWDRTRVLESLRTNGASIGNASPFWYELHPSGARVKLAHGAGDAEVLAAMVAQGMVLTPTISNSFDAKRLTKMLATPATRARHVAQLAAITARPEYAGLDVDYENLALKDRAKFGLFVAELAAALHAQGKVLSVTVMAATGPRSGSIGAAATDYATIAAHADEVRVMAYDYHWACGKPGPIGPITWVRSVVEYLVTVVPADKLVLGVPLYGYDWPKRGCAKSRTWRDAAAIRSSQTREREAWYAKWGTFVMTYANRTLWYENAASTEAKAAIAAEFDLRGVAMWRLGGEDPGTWSVLEGTLGAGSDGADEALPDPGLPIDPAAGVVQ